MEAEPEKIQIDTTGKSDRFYSITLAKNEFNENILCDVCLDDEDDENDEIVICDLCLCAVHQTCYGSELLKSVPKGDWFCARCRDLK